jgi:polyketide biosynthesis acyl carrier protein
MTTTDTIFDLIARSAREVLPDLETHAFTRGDSLAELGANSMDRAEITMLVMEQLALKIPRTELFGPNNIGELADLLHAKLHTA